MDRISNILKGFFITVIIGVFFFSVKDTFCDVHVVNLGSRGSIFFKSDAEYEAFLNNSDFYVTVDGYLASKNYCSYTNPDAKQLLAQAQGYDEKNRKEYFDAIYNSSIVYHTCDYKETWTAGADIMGNPMAVTQFICNGTTSQETSRTTRTYAQEEQEKNGYKVLEEVSQNDEIPEDMKPYVDAFMSDFRTFAINLGNGDVLNKNSDVKQRLEKYCMEAGFNSSIAYGMIKYALEYGDEDLKNAILNPSSSASTDFNNYGDKNKLYDYSSANHKAFYYFINEFYKTDCAEQKGNADAYNTSDISTYYTGVMGHIAIDSNAELNSAFTLLGDAFLDVLSSATDELAEKVIRNIARDICWGILEVLNRTDEAIMDFCPSIEQYLKYFGGVGASDSMDAVSQENSVPELFDLNTLFYYLGAFLLVLLTIIQLVTIIVNPEEAKTDIPHLIARFIVFVIFIYWGRHIIGYVFRVTNYIWEWCFSGKNFRYDDMKIIYKSIGLVTYDYLGISWEYSVIGVIFNCAIGFIIIKNIFMVLAECIERYIVAVMLYFTFPVALSFGVSNTTSNILVSYFRMLGTQLFMLFMNLYFIHGFVMLTNNMDVWANSFYGLIFVVAYLKVAQAFDSYLSSLGLSVAHTSGRMASELLGVGSTLLAGTMMLGRIGMQVGRGLANLGARGAGSALATGAILSGSQSKSALKAFNMGENLRTQGLRGIMGGSRLNQSTLMNLNSAQTGKFGLTRPETLRNAFAGGANASLLNANKLTSGNALMQALGTGVTGNGRIASARFNQMGGGATYTGSVTTANGRMIKTSGSLGLNDTQLKTGNGASASRVFGVATTGDVMKGTIGYNTNVRSGDTFKLDRGSLNRVGGEYAVTNAEMGLGADLFTNERVRANTLDLVSQGHDITLTKQANGKIMVSDNGNTIGFTSATGDRWEEAGIRANTFDLNDLNNGKLSYLKPTETSEAIAVGSWADVANGNLNLNPDFMEQYGYYRNPNSESGQTNYFAEKEACEAELANADAKYKETAEAYIKALHTEGSEERTRYIEEAMSSSLNDNQNEILPEDWVDTMNENDIEAMLPNSIEELEAQSDQQMWKKCIDSGSEYAYLRDYADECAKVNEKMQENYDLFMKDKDFDDNATIAFFEDRSDDRTLYATEIHPVTEAESDSVKTEYTAIPLDISRDLAGDEYHVKERDFHKVNNTPKPDNRHYED